MQTSFAFHEVTATTPTPSITLHQLVEEWLADAKPRFRASTYNEAKRCITKHILPVLGDRPVDDIHRKEIGAILTTLKPSIARNSLTHLRTCIRWGLSTGRNDVDATHGLKSRPPRSRDRVHTPEELKAIWHALDDMGDYGRIVRLLILCGARRQEIGGLLWSEVDLAKRQIVLPATRTKNKRQHIIPLSDLAISLLPESRERYPHVFGKVWNKGFTGWGKCWGILKKRMGGPQTWVLHDFRRSLATLGSEMGLGPPHVFDASLGHVQPGVAGRYNRATFLTERRAALEAWSVYIAKLILNNQKQTGRQDPQAQQRAIAPIHQENDQ